MPIDAYPDEPDDVKVIHVQSRCLPDDDRHRLNPDDAPVSSPIVRIQSHPSDVDALLDIGVFCVCIDSDDVDDGQDNLDDNSSKDNRISDR